MRGPLAPTSLPTTDDSVTWLCVDFFFSTAEKLARLNAVAAVFEYSVDGQGGTKGTFTQWK